MLAVGKREWRAWSAYLVPHVRRYGRSSPGPPARQQEQTTARSTQQVVSDICQIGFERRRVESVLAEMLQSGKEIDLNAVVDRLMSESR